MKGALRALAPASPGESARIAARTWWLCLVLGTLFTLLSGRLAVLQLTRHEQLAAVARDYRVRKEILPARRGAIYDRHGELLARNQTVYTLYADKYHLADYNVAVAGLSRATGLSATEVRRTYSRKDLLLAYRKHVIHVVGPALPNPAAMAGALAKPGLGQVILGKGFDLIRKDQWQAKMRKHGVKGVYFKKSERRFYPSPHRAGHILGYVDSKNRGKEGVERVLDESLRGEQGFRMIERDNRGREIAAFRCEQMPAVDGLNLRLTIDMGLQCLVEDRMDLAMARHQPDKMTVIFLDPRTGEILAMANRPSFDLSTRKGSRRNFAVSDRYEPGSTFKVVAGSAALDLGAAGLDTTVFCHYGEMREPNNVVRDSGTYGDLTLAGVLAKSSNIGMYKIVRRIEPEQFLRYIGYFGFGEPTGVRLTAETGGEIHPVEKWGVSSLSRMAMGYEVGVSALQMLNAVAAIANGGELLGPRIVRWVERESGEPLQRTEPVFIRRVMSRASAHAMIRALTGVVEGGGSGWRAAVPGYGVAGKTGTAQRYSEQTGGYVPGSVVVSFVGFLPAENPQLAGIVVLHGPRFPPQKLYGGSVAAPIFAGMAKEAVGHLGIEPTRFSEQVVSAGH